MSEQRDPDGPAEPEVRDSSNVIEGEIGHARLKEPSDDPEMGADLDRLPEIESGPGAGTRKETDARNGSV
jgi:hypothetical protein